MNADPRDRFEAVFRAHHGAVLAYALRRCDPETAQDVVSDTFLVCWRRLDDVPAEPRPWLYGVARKTLANRRRGAERAERAAVAVPRDHARDPGDQLSEQHRIRAAFAHLSEGDREVLRLVAWEDLDHASAARALGCSRTAFAVRLHRARRRLEAQLAEPAGRHSTTSIREPA